MPNMQPNTQPNMQVADVQITIPKALADKLSQRCGTEFSTLSGYATYILEQVLNKVEQSEQIQGQSQQSVNPKKPEQEKVFSEEEEQKVKARLQSLGYLD